MLIRSSNKLLKVFNLVQSKLNSLFLLSLQSLDLFFQTGQYFLILIFAQTVHIEVKSFYEDCLAAILLLLQKFLEHLLQPRLLFFNCSTLCFDYMVKLNEVISTLTHFLFHFAHQPETFFCRCLTKLF